MADRETWNQRYAASDLVWSSGPNRLFAELVADLPPGRALDLGCGEGRNALWLAERGWTVTAVDYSSVGIDKGRQLAIHRGVTVDFRVEDAAAFEPAPGSFDLVAIVFLHNPPVLRDIWLGRAIAAVRRGGYFLYIGHDPGNIDHGVGGPQDPAVLPSAEVIDPGHGAETGGIALDTCVFARLQ